MKYLFFDIECASVHKGSKICSFGYVLADENLNILDSKDIIVHPNCVWDWYALANILAHPKEYYESYPSFDKQYEIIKKLFSDDVIAFGHGIINDVRFLNDDCKRYNLPYIDFVFYDCADIYKEFENDKEVKSLAKVSNEIGEHKQGEKHESKQDAFLVYEYTKEMCEQMNTNLKELLQLVPNCKGQNKNGMCSYRNVKKKQKKENKDRGRLYECFLENVKENASVENKILNGKKIAVSIDYEKKNFKQMLLLIQMITDLGGEYVVDSKECDVFVMGNPNNKQKVYCEREFIVDQEIDKGKDTEKLYMYEFMGLIGYDENEVENNYKRVCKDIVKIIRKEEKENKKVPVK